MVNYILRDYNPVTTGYATNASHLSYLYLMPLFLYRVMGYSIIGATGLNYNTTNRVLTVTNATNTSPIQITTSTPHGFPSDSSQGVFISGVGGITTANGTFTIDVTGPSTFTLRGAVGNTTYTSGGTVTAGFLFASGLITDGYGAGINFGAGVERNVSIPIFKRKVVAGDIGKILILKSDKYPTKNAGLFKITALNTGNTTTIALASSGTTTIAAASNGQSLPQATINVASTTNFPTSGSIFVTTSNGVQTVNYTGKGATTFTGCTGGTGTMSTGNTVTNTIATLPQPTINVASTAGFPTSGTIFITLASNGTTQTVTYTGTTGTTFTGCSGGTGIMTVSDAVANLNRYVIDYRSTENPPVEADNSMDWWVYEIENLAEDQMTTLTYTNSFSITGASNTTPITITSAFSPGVTIGQKITITDVLGNTAANGTWIITSLPTSFTFTLGGSTGNGTYSAGTGIYYLDGNLSFGTAPMSRIVLQSPHASGWQVRMASEYRDADLPIVSVTTGYNANGNGDFLKGEPQTHLGGFFDVNLVRAGLYGNMTPGGGEPSTAITRITMVADGYGKNVFCYTRSGTNNGLLNFGLPDNEPFPTPPNVERIYSYGSANNAVAGTHLFGGISLRIGATQQTGTAFKIFPRFCSLTGWANLDGTSATSPMFSANAGDSPFTGTTEVLPVEIWAGTNADIALTGGSSPPFFFDQAYMGTSPFLRLGRSNFGAFTLSTEEITSRTVTAATNASPIQITTSAVNALTTGQTVTISGVGGNTAANGTFTITVINNQNFTLDGTTGNGTYTSGGTVNGCPRWIHLQNGIYLQWNSIGGITP